MTTQPLSGDRMVAVARALATRAHAGQTDKAGRPYIEHPADVASRLDDADARAAAWLHDVVEDTDVTLADLRTAGFPDAVVDAVDAVTKRPGENYEDAIARAGQDPVGRLVKRADIASNTDPARTALLDDVTRARLAAKYARGLALLESCGA